MKNEALEKLIDYLKGEIERLKEYDTSFDSKSWGYEEGILITGNEALTIIKACEGKPDSDTSGGLHLAGVNARFSSETELRTFIQMHLPIAIRPTKPAKTMFVGAFTSANAEKVVVDALVEAFLNGR